MASLLRFKTSTPSAFGYQRNGVWGETVSQKVEHLSLMFGAFVGGPKSAVRGYGIEVSALSLECWYFRRCGIGTSSGARK
jgi:hypothetical protein